MARTHHRRRRHHAVSAAPHRRRRHHRRRRRSVGAMPGTETLVMLGSAGAGFFLGDTLNPMVDKVTSMLPLPAPAAGTPTTGIASLGLNTNTIGLALEAGLGAALLLKKRKSTVTAALGGLSAGLAVQRLLKTMGIVSGFQSVPVIGRRMGGYQSVPVIGKMPQQLSGYPSVLSGMGDQGFRVNGYVPVGSGSINGLYKDYGVNGCGSGVNHGSGSELMN